MSRHPQTNEAPSRRPPDLRLFLAALGIFFQLSRAYLTYALVALLSLGLACIGLCYVLGRASRDIVGSRRRAAEAVSGNRDLLLVAAVLFVGAVVLRASEVLLLAWLYVGFALAPAHEERDRQSIRLGLNLALILAAATVLCHRWLCLVPTGWYRWPVVMASRLWGRLLGLGGIGTCANHIVVDGNALHMSWLLGIGACLPVFYCLLALGESWRAKLAKAFGALLVMSAAGFAATCAALGFGYGQFTVSPVSVALPILQSVVALAVSLVLWDWHRVPPPSIPPRAARFSHWLLLIPPAAAMVCLFLLNGIGAERPRIAIDECHGRWETTEGSFDTVEYGRDTVYNYRLLRERLASLYRVSTVHTKMVGVDADIILIKTPTVYFSDEEKRFLRHFVENGGSLFVIGDHTNLFGSSAIIDDAISWTGMRLRYDAVLPVGRRYQDLRPTWWNPLIGGPAIRDVQFQTSCSIAGNPLRHQPLIVAENAVGEDADYSDERFFGGLSPTLDDRRGPLCLAAKARVGKGSVVLFGDSTIWSNFSVFAASNEQLLLAMLWNCRHSSGAGTVAAAFALGLLGLLCTAAGRRSMAHPAGLLSLATVSAVTLLLFRVSMLAAGPPVPPPSMGTARRIVLDGAHSSAWFRADTRTGDASELRDYSTFYAWLSRAGVHPVSAWLPPYATPTLPVLVINPVRGFSAPELDEIEDYLRQGGRMLFLFDPALPGLNASADFLARFGVGVKASRSPASLHDAEGPQTTESVLSLPFTLLMQGHSAPGDERMSLGQPAYCLVGLNALLTDDDGLVVAGEKRVGTGRLVVFAKSTMMSEFFLGDVWGGKDPSPEKRKAYDLVYDLARYTVDAVPPGH